LTALRPRQWIKNLVVIAGLIFSRNTFNVPLLEKTVATFVCFCAVVGPGYLIYDLLDRESDRVHPTKRNRPIASGSLGTGAALVVAAALVTIALAGGFIVDPMLPLLLTAYLALQLLYSLLLKHIVIVDVLVIAAGFLLRAAAGAVVIHVAISPWLVVCAMLLALFLGLAKRRAELALLEETAASYRRNLEHYSIELIDQMTSVTAAATLVSYSFYSFSAFEPRTMMLTIPFVLYGIFRYLYLVHEHLKGGSPEQILLTDKPLLADIILWVITAETVLNWA